MRIGALLPGRRWLQPLWVLALGVGLATYFGYHALTGSRGLLAWRQVSAELTSTRKQLEDLRADRAALEQKVARLRHDGLDPDLIDELARRQLSLADPLDVIILLDDKTIGR
jgi:cell division protein FtsB